MSKLNSKKTSGGIFSLDYICKNCVSFILLLLLISLLIFQCVFSNKAFAENNELDTSFSTKSFDVTVDINEDYSFKFTENINVFFSQGKHGIFRYIPVNHSKYSLYPNLQSYPHMMEEESIWFSKRFPIHTVSLIKFGDPDSYKYGNTNYELQYLIRGKLSKYNKGDTVLLNILPTRWPNSIENTTIRINYFSSLDWSKVKVYAGDELSTQSIENNQNFSAYQENESTYIIKGKNILPNTGLTIEIPTKEVVWKNPYNFDELNRILTIVALVVSVIFFIMYFFRKRAYKIVPVVEFFPPDNLPPADIGYIIDSTIDPKDISSMLLYFANKGYLSIKPISDSVDSKGNPKDFIFKKLKDLDLDEDEYAVALFYNIFSNGNTFRTDDKTSNFALASELAKQGLDEKYRKDLLNPAYKVFPFIINIIVLMLTGYHLYNAVLCSSLELICLLGVAAIASLLRGQILLKSCYLKKDILTPKKLKQKSFFAFSYIIFTMVIVIFFFKSAFDDYLLSSLAYLMLFISSSLVQLSVMGRISKKMADIKSRILGFKHFIEVSEKDRLEVLVRDNPNYFFDILPYAYALGISDVWIKNLQKLDKIPQMPYWYDGSSMNIHYVFLANSLLRSSQRAYTNSALAHGKAVAGKMLSQGASMALKGGKFTGGGFGGGGGGSW